jgi:hypothetical protein
MQALLQLIDVDLFASIDADFVSIDADFASIDADFASIDADFVSIDADFASSDANFASIDAELFASVDVDLFESIRSLIDAEPLKCAYPNLDIKPHRQSINLQPKSYILLKILTSNMRRKLRVV